MLKKLASTLALITLLFSAATHALPIVQADAFNAGDNKAALETNTGLVWMDFGVNDHRTFSDVINSLDSDYAGWRLPTIAEVDHLWLSLVGDLVGWNRWYPEFGSLNLIENNEYGLPVTAYDDYFHSIMEVFGSHGEYSVGYTDEYGQYNPYTFTGVYGVFSESGVNGYTQIFMPLNSSISRSAVFTYDMNNPYMQDISLMQGTLLVKDAATVSEPAGGLLAILAIFMFVVRRVKYRA